MWMLDTDTCSYILRSRPPAAVARLVRTPRGEIGISTVVLAELLCGAERLPNRIPLRKYIAEFASGLVHRAWDDSAARHYGFIRAELDRKGAPLSAMDLMIAAHARSLNAVLVTNNTKHFSRVPNLKLDNWALR